MSAAGQRQERPRRAGRSLPLALALALRYRKSRRRDAFTTFLSLTASLGMAFGVFALVVALAVLSGMQRALRREVLASTPHLEAELAATISPQAAREAVLSVPGVERARIVVQGRGWLVSAGRVRAVELIGFAGGVPRIFAGASDLGEGLYVSSRLATAWGLDEGELVELVSARPTLTPLGPQPRTRRLPLAGTYDSSASEERERVALPWTVAESLLGRSERRLQVETAGFEQALALAPRVAEALPAGSRLATWQDLNRPLLFALRLEKVMVFVAVALVSLVASLALVASLSLTVANKRREIGMLRAMGCRRRTIRRTFLLLGLVLAGSGALSGALFGAALCWLLDRYRLIPLPRDLYFIDYLPFALQPGDLGAVTLLTVALAVAASLWTARRAAALVPVEALRR